MEREKQEQGHVRIVNEAPNLWGTFTELIGREVKKLAETFPGQESMVLRFEWDLADKIVVSCPSNRNSFSAQWNPGDMVFKLAFTQQLFGLDGTPAGHDQINLVALPTGDVVPVYGSATGMEAIAEHLLKRLLTPPSPPPFVQES